MASRERHPLDGQWTATDAMLDEQHAATEKEIAIGGLLFLLTCGWSPEQYDVIDGRGKEVGYVRLRHGRLTADYGHRGGNGGWIEVYRKYLDYGNNQPCFADHEERMKHLTEIAGILKSHVKMDRRATRSSTRRGETM